MGPLARAVGASALALAVVVGCRAPGEQVVDAVDPVALVGSYQAAVAARGLVSLELAEDGTYEALVLAGMGPDGCGSVVGNGISQGTWVLADGVVQLRPSDETPDLVLTLVGARAEPTDEGLDLLFDGERFAFRALGPSPY